QHQRAREGRPARPGHRDGGRCSGHSGVRRRGRRRRVLGRCLSRGQESQGAARAEAGEGPGMSSVTVLRSRTNTVEIGAGRPFCVIGERINPTGRKKFAEDLRAGELSTVTHDAVAQVEAGADMLDVNAGIPLVDEAELLATMLRTVQAAVDVPICIDSSVIDALEAGLSAYEGRALVNSGTAEDDRLSEILPLVARHGAAVIGLANDETGIPETPAKRLECARKIVSAAADYGIAAEDVVIDPLAMTVGADP